MRAIRSFALLCLVALGAILAAGCGEAPSQLPPEWKGRDLDAPGWLDGELRPGWTLGLEYAWSSGKEVPWDWLTNGTARLHFQVMRMEDGRAQPVVGQVRDESSGQITAPTAGAYHILFGNEGLTTVDFWYQVPEGGLTRLYPPGESPDCPPARLLGTVLGTAAC